MFSKWKRSVQADIEAEIILNQLHLLGSDALTGNCKISDLSFWHGKLDELEELAKDNEALTGALKAYKLIFNYYKAQLEEAPIIDLNEILTEAPEQNTKSPEPSVEVANKVE